MMGEEGGTFVVRRTVGMVLCCKCGISMEPNALSMCVKCACLEFDITQGMRKHAMIMHCPDCGSYLQPPRTWIKADLESKELLSFCVNRVRRDMKGVRLVQADFIWTEPHSRRIKLKLRVQKEILKGAVLEQSYAVEFVVQAHMCDSCARLEANPDQWVAVVQLRQHVSHRRTFFYLEQLILRHGAALRCVRITQVERGIDFCFSKQSHAEKFVGFVRAVAPVRTHGDKQLVSHDTKSNTYGYRYSFSVEICPVCREDVVCLPRRLSSSLGNLGPLVLCTKVSTAVALLDPLTLRHCFLDAEAYWRSPFASIFTSRQLVEYIVLDIEPVGGFDPSSHYALADAQVARVSDFGRNDTVFSSVRTHLGRLLSPGDYALGYDLYGANWNDLEMDRYSGGPALPDVILVKKSYEERRLKKGRRSGRTARAWKLKRLAIEPDSGGGDREKTDREYEQFLRDLEENPDMRFDISLYRDADYRQSPSDMIRQSADDADDDTSPLPEVPIEEMLADLDLASSSHDDDGDGG